MVVGDVVVVLLVVVFFTTVEFVDVYGAVVDVVAGWVDVLLVAVGVDVIGEVHYWQSEMKGSQQELISILTIPTLSIIFRS